MQDGTIRVLLVESNLSDGHVRQLLSAGSQSIHFVTEMTADFLEATRLLGCKNYDVVIVDLQLSESRFDCIEKIRASDAYMPLIVMTESGDEEIGIEAIRCGADDYLVKGKIFADVLRRSIRYAIERKKEQKRVEEKLAELVAKLEESNGELKDFAYIVSHDLKAPLRGIKTLADWIANDYGDKLGEQGKERIGLLLSRVERMHNLINGVLEYSRVGRVREEHVEVDLNKLVGEIIESLGAAENISIEVANDLPMVICEETRITEVFQNLLSNAIKFMDKPQGRIRVGSEEEDSYWKFYVRDNGPGISEKNYEKIFHMFRTLRPRDEFESTGVGLAVVKKIVEMYGGRIWVESTLGKGSTFFFTLPKLACPCENSKELVMSDG